MSNNKPILDPESPERRPVEAAGWIGWQDGMGFTA